MTVIVNLNFKKQTLQNDKENCFLIHQLTALATRHKIISVFIQSLKQTKMLTVSGVRDDQSLLIYRAEMTSSPL